MDEDDFAGSEQHKNNIQNTYEYMNDKSFERAPEIFESDPIDSDRESQDSQPEIVKVELDLQLM